jgi:site-specific recombinase XerD
MESGWAETAEGFRLYLVSRGYSGETIRGYLGYTVIPYRWFHLRERDLCEVSAREVALFLSEAARKHSRNTVRNFTCALRCFFRYCITEGVRANDPTAGMSVRKPKLQPRRPFARTELQALYDAATQPVDRLLFLLLISTGIRIGEATRLRIQDIDLVRGVAVIHGKGAKDRWIALKPSVVGAMNAYLAGRTTGPLLLTQDCRPMSRERARKRLEALGLKAGVVKVYPHRFRITFANHFLESGGDMGALQDALGHEDIATTNHYAGYSKAQRALEQMLRFNPTDSLIN